MIKESEQGSNFDHLTSDYLKSGNWIKEGLVTKILDDPKLMCRLLIGYSIITMIENYESVEDKLFDLVDAMDDLSDEIIQLTEEDTNLFDISNPKFAVALESLNVSILTPKQIIVLGRYADQRRLIQNDLVEINDEVALSEDPMDILEYSKRLSKIANRSCYDQGNINYEISRVYTRQLKMVNVLERMDDSFTTITGLESQQLRKIWQNIPYDEIASKWEGYLPTL
jgi:hypothetical protein